MLIKANVWIYVFQLVVLKVSYDVHGLESVHIRVPPAVTLGGSAILICECDLPDEDLYSVKWYKGKHEFFRYTSKEIPSIKIFPKAGISVDVNHSNASHVILLNAEPHTSGKYSCEITEAAPSFHTQIVTRDLNVVDLPKSDPVILDMKPYYGADEFLEVVCISNESLPAARLEWFINERPLGKIQPPSRLEAVTVPVTRSGHGVDDSSNHADRGNSSNNNNNSSGSSSRKPTKSSPHQISAALQTTTTNEDDDRLVRDANSPQHRDALTVPLAAAIIAGATVLSSATTSAAAAAASGLATLAPSSTAVAAASASSRGGKKGTTNSRYERSLSRLKLLLGHEHFVEGKIRVKCTARIFDLYERTAQQVADENYPQVRVLSNSDNGVHFSFMSDKDEVSSSASSSHHPALWHRNPVARWLLQAGTGCWWLTGTSSKLQDTGQEDGPNLVHYVLLFVIFVVVLVAVLANPSATTGTT
ncbi:protein abrupt-like [Malaya genurostris]|uniref:protein abrupt-like n=1 Tax=Malaya genurostris TaxID=325434 RepID=UPI0026F40864|nr:protein abrupt-like [Malaya genurostris]XP_058444839.1 protein abrupt-like [Malaya genurostris]